MNKELTIGNWDGDVQEDPKTGQELHGLQTQNFHTEGFSLNVLFQQKGFVFFFLKCLDATKKLMLKEDGGDLNSHNSSLFSVSL